MGSFDVNNGDLLPAQIHAQHVDVALALKSFEVACRVILRGGVGVENGELEVGVHGLT
jgi:hypothetical protein